MMPGRTDLNPRRRLTLADLLILIAWTAVGLVILRAYHMYRPTSPPGIWIPWAWRYGMEATPLLGSWALALIVLRMRRPRPRWRRIFRQPGMVACTAIAFLVLIQCLCLPVRQALEASRQGMWYTYTIDVYISTVFQSGKAVLIAWMVLALAGAWRPEPSWIDRAGRAIGSIMIGLWFAEQLAL